MSPSLQPQSAAPSHPLAVYEQCVRDGKLKNDDAQRMVSAKLQALHEQLNGAPRRSFLSSFLPAR